MKLFSFACNSLGGKLNSAYLTSALLWLPPCSWRSAKPKKKDKRYYFEGERDTGALSGEPFVGAHTPSMMFDRPLYMISTLPFSLPPALLWRRDFFFCKTQSCKTAEIKSMQCNSLASFSHKAVKIMIYSWYFTWCVKFPAYRYESKHSVLFILSKGFWASFF